MPVIKPTPGRIVWFKPRPTDPINFTGARGSHGDAEQPLAAILAYVHGDRLVNLSVIDAHGAHHPRLSVVLIQEGDETPPDGQAYAYWMPYQQGQAAKTAAAEAKAVGGK